MQPRESGHDALRWFEALGGLLPGLAAQAEFLGERLFRAFAANSSVFLIGNGGSASNASHFAQDLAKGTAPGLDAERRLRAVALTDNASFLTALANDVGYERVFEQQLRTLARRGDLLIAISGSGNSPNVLRAVEWARDAGLETLGVTGFDGGKLRALADAGVHVACSDMGMCETLHAALFHCAMNGLRERIARHERR
jgi:D-sedoheptulose 7-phosphate isomerase